MRLFVKLASSSDHRSFTEEVISLQCISQASSSQQMFRAYILRVYETEYNFFRISCRVAECP